jgi:hypothetical protein
MLRLITARRPGWKERSALSHQSNT